MSAPIKPWPPLAALSLRRRGRPALGWGGLRPRSAPDALAADLRLFATTFAVGFLFVSLFLA